MQELLIAMEDASQFRGLTDDSNNDCYLFNADFSCRFWDVEKALTRLRSVLWITMGFWCSYRAVPCVEMARASFTGKPDFWLAAFKVYLPLFVLLDQTDRASPSPKTFHFETGPTFASARSEKGNEKAKSFLSGEQDYLYDSVSRGDLTLWTWFGLSNLLSLWRTRGVYMNHHILHV